MEEKCLGCQQETKDGTYACQVCMAKINAVRNEAEVKKWLKKNFLAFWNNHLSMLSVFISIMAFVMAFLLFLNLKINTQFQLNILSHALTGFVVYFLAYALYMRYMASAFFRQLANKGYYSQGWLERIMDIAGLKVILAFLLAYLVAWIALIAAVTFVDKGWNFKLPASLLAVRQAVVEGFILSGTGAGMAFSLSRYFAWVEKLEK
ncbi:MAG: hypothetical protein PHG31_02495 [Candidatus Omnitrophica bacterium]|nr:hypothetical protein [Candidatus Omnitrophota bacterium]